MYLTQVTIEAQVEEEDLESRVPTNEIAHIDQLDHLDQDLVKKEELERNFW